jgi:2-polyprenyl-3-methyl-5-hydroxy-6-metoxy-1,4-benzoquinol methylase
MNKFCDNFSSVNGKASIVFKQEEVPIFQNKVYPTIAEALNVQKGNVELVQSEVSGFIFNRAFDSSLMHYDQHYQNEQSNSLVFKDHLQNVLALLNSFGLRNKRVIEVGCGKGIFFEMMLRDGIECWGFDPTYEGNNDRIIKEYFSEKTNIAKADVIIMRHTLEHIPNPFSFIHTIAKANGYQGMLFVEVPTFNWIVEKNAFWDVFYEHCNYFTEQSMAAMFEESITGTFFGGQYMYLWADLSKLRTAIPEGLSFSNRKGLIFEEKLSYYKSFLKTSGSVAIWGAGAKGSTFLNLLDKNRSAVAYVIDINPKKQNCFIGGTGHSILSPEILDSKPVDHILVMNENYLEEIEETIADRPIHLHHL